MKKRQILLVVWLLIALGTFFSCSEETSPVGDNKKLDTLSISHSMKGWELYSWAEDGVWNYSVLIGTNRVKTYQEVVENDLAVMGKDSLKILLNKFPANETITWLGGEWLANSWSGSHENISLPETAIINEIKAYCTQKQLELVILQ